MVVRRALGIGLLLGGTPAMAQTVPTGPVPVRHGITLTPEQLFDVAGQLASAGRWREAIHFLEPLTTNPNADYRAEARVRIARYYLALGKPAQAVAWYEKLLEEKPNAAAVRIELAQALAQMGNISGASHQMQRAAAAKGLPDAVSRAIGQVGAALQDDAPVRFSISLGIAPDTNINHATQAQAVSIYGLPFTLNQNAQAQSGIGVTSSADIVVQHKLDSGTRLVAELAESGNSYRDTNFDDIAVTTNVGAEFVHDKVSLHPALVLGRRWYGTQALYDVYGATATLKLALASKALLSITSSALQFDYP
ncbi:MAG: tetratricopeptide repeat protein, partial [Alphaproteobacteria bacterium]|nr:tetratricopeptide repeat protein [Alphaproteobacteria bacterium]